MIELKFSKDDILEYLDTEELQRNAEYSVKTAIREEIQKILKEDNVVKRMLDLSIEKIMKNDIVFEEKVKDAIKSRVLDSIKNTDDYHLEL